jgi:hypothetical protein
MMITTISSSTNAWRIANILMPKKEEKNLRVKKLGTEVPGLEWTSRRGLLSTLK